MHYGVLPVDYCCRDRELYRSCLRRKKGPLEGKHMLMVALPQELAAAYQRPPDFFDRKINTVYVANRQGMADVRMGTLTNH